MKTIKIFLASSEELVGDRRVFEIFLGRQNKYLVKEGIFLELVIWEDFLDAMSNTRLQDKYNDALKECDIFILLFFSKVGKYTEEEFDTAYQQFKDTGHPLIFTYFKDAEINASDTSEKTTSLLNFKKRLSDLGHFYSTYKNEEGLQLHFMSQLQKLRERGFFSKDEEKGGGKSNGDVFTEVKQAIAKGTAIAKILDKHRAEILAIDEDRDMELTLLQGRSNKLSKDERIGIISSSDAGIERARITNALLSILDDIKDEFG